MGDDGTEDSCDVTGGEGDDQLLGLAALVPWFRHNIGLGFEAVSGVLLISFDVSTYIKGLDGSLKAGKLHHGVWNLTTP